MKNRSKSDSMRLFALTDSLNRTNLSEIINERVVCEKVVCLLFDFIVVVF